MAKPGASVQQQPVSASAVLLEFRALGFRGFVGFGLRV